LSIGETMLKLASTILALTSALVLAGCYESAMPLIAASDFPFTRIVRYSFYEWNADKKQWDMSETGLVVRDQDHYMQLPDMADITDGKNFSLKGIGGGLYVAQQFDDRAYDYDLVKIDGNTIYEYGMPCAAEDRKFVAQKLIDDFKADPQFGNTCTVSNFDKLAQVFRSLAAGNPQPQGKYVIDP
jgi:hypothetical protein